MESCVVPSDWGGQTAKGAAVVALMDCPFIDQGKNQYVFSEFLRTVLILFVEQLNNMSFNTNDVWQTKL